MQVFTQRITLAVLIGLSLLAMASGSPPANPAAPNAPGSNAVQPGQAVVPPVTTTQPGPAAWGHERLQADLVRMAIGCNEAEISLAQLAQTRAQTPQVKQFAEEMIRDHTGFVRQLQGFVQAGNWQPQPEKPGVRIEVNPQGTSVLTPAGAPLPGRATVQVQTTPTLADPMFFVASQIQKRTGELIRNELNQQQGIRFDQAYIGQQIGAHLQMLAALQVARNYVSPAVQQVFDAGIRSTTDHLNLAHNAMQQLESAVARQPGQPSSGVPTRE